MVVAPDVAYVVLLLIALLPGAISWSLGHRLIQRIADPALPELLARHRRRVGVIFSIGMTVLGCMAVLTGGHVAVLIISGFLISYTGLLAAAYPLRRALYNETWSVLAYLSFYPRGIVGVFGFWLTLSAFPIVVAVAGAHDWLYALPLGIALVVWQIRYADVLRWCLRCQPLPEGDLLAGCRALAEKCDLPQVRFERIPLGGGVIANALALPSLRGSSVLFTETLLERFDRDEILAVAAHELAHFDHYNPRYLRRLRATNGLLIALGVTAGPIARAVGREWGLVPTMLWLFIVVLSLTLRARGKQRQETMCDLKAVKLTGNPEAVISGLTKLYTIARLPRRLDNRTERGATHPSLARRIRDIRKAAGSNAETLAAAHTFASSDGHSSATFDGSGLQWIDRDGIVYTLAYSHLTELRIEVANGRSTRLVAVGPSARRWDMALRDTDIAKVQAVLDRIDVELADPPAARATLALNPGFTRIAVLAVVAIGLALGQLGMAVVALLVWAKPTVPMFIAGGVAALTTAAFMLRDLSESYLSELWVPLTVVAFFFFGLAWSARHTPRDGSRKYLAALAIAAGLSIAALAFQGPDIVDLHRSARDLPSATVFLVALAGALFCSTDRRERLGGLAAALAAGAITSIASTPFLDRFATDPFLLHSRALRWVALDASPIAAFEVPANTSRIELSPGGKYIAVYNSSNGDRAVAGSVQVGRPGDQLSSVAADEIAFVSDDQFLSLTSNTHATVVQAETLGTSRNVVWKHALDSVWESTLSLDRASGRWSLIGWDGEDTIVRADGAFDGSDFHEKRWALGEDRDGYIAALTSSGPNVLLQETHYEPGLVSRLVPLRWTSLQLMLHMAARPVSHFSTINEQGPLSSYDSKLDAACNADVLPDGALVCAAYDGSRTHIVSLSTASNRAAGVGWLDGRFVTDRCAAQGWLTGWVVGRPAAIHLPSGAIFHTLPEMRPLRLIPMAGDRLAVLTFAGQRVRAAIYAPLRESRRAGAPVAQMRTRVDRP